MKPDFSRIEARLAIATTSQIVQVARMLQNDLSDEATLVMGRALAELAKRVDQAEFIAICEDLDGRLTDQTARADPMHY